jgi:hypothetical protein
VIQMRISRRADETVEAPIPIIDFIRQDSEDTEEEWWRKKSGNSHCSGSNRATGCKSEAGAGSGRKVPCRLLRLSAGKSALDAVGQARQRCWRYDWVIDLDIKAFFDNLDQSLLLRAVKKHASQQWMVLYIEGWLKAPVQGEDERLVPREKGTPQGGVVSPLLANLFLHYALDRWMAANYAQVPFERYADDVIVHCRTEREAKEVRMAIAERLRDCGLELHPEKTKIVYYYGRFTARRSALDRAPTGPRAGPLGQA